MITATQISGMSRTEKIQAMEILWSDISQDIEEVEPPPWHGQLLRETEARFANGQEEAIDWNLAKEQLRKRFE